MRNLKLAFRTLFRTPFVTGIAILSLALGIGGNAAIYSLMDQMLMRSLPVADPGQLVNFSAPGPKPGSQSCTQAGSCDDVFSYPMYRDLEKANMPFSSIAAHRSFGANLSFRNQTLSSEGLMVSGSYFSTLGVRPALGRLLGPADDEGIGSSFVAVLSHAYWTTQMGADPGVLNQPIIINGHTMTIVGVAPPGFDGTTLGSNPRVFVPISMRAEMNPGFTDFENRRSYWMYVFGRLAPGTTLEQASAAINAVYRPIIQDVEAPLQTGMSDQRMQEFLAREVVLTEGGRGQSSVHEDVRMPLTILMAITVIVLIIACANIANLLLARAAKRSLEMAVRLSIGAGRRQLLAQLLTESTLLAVLGGVASLAVAYWTLQGIGSILPPQARETVHLSLDWRVISFAGLLSLGTGVLFGLFPAIHSTRPDLITTLRGNTGQPSGARSAARFRTGLVTAQIALSMALLVSAGLFIRSLVNVSRVNLGMDTSNVVTFGVSPELNGYDNERSKIFFESLEDELSALPGVTGVSASLVPVLAGSNWGTDVNVQGFERTPDTNANSNYSLIGPDYFSTLGVPLIAGREFTRADVSGSGRVAIVNEAFARKFGLGRDAVDKFMSLGSSEDELNIQIVGLVQDAKYSQVKDTVPPVFFTPYRQSEQVGSMFFYVRTSGSTSELMSAVPRVVSGLDPNLPVEELRTLVRQVEQNVFLDRVISILSAAFAVLATLLAAVGLYGVLSYTVAQRTREIGVRMALGASGGNVRAMVLRQVIIMLVVGGLVGLAAALGLGRMAGSLLFGLEPYDVGSMVGAVAVLTVVALCAGYLPAHRASRVEPMSALRYE
jgi:predicted permease